ITWFKPFSRTARSRPLAQGQKASFKMRRTLFLRSPRESLGTRLPFTHAHRVSMFPQHKTAFISPFPP
ncbi:hypothetical protein RSAG8_05059, partial [Rhizoctonia solani AG-8 WAC10335]